MKSSLPNVAETEVKNGIRMVTLASSLVYCTPSIFKKQSTDVRTALMMIKDSSELLGILLMVDIQQLQGDWRAPIEI